MAIPLHEQSWSQGSFAKNQACKVPIYLCHNFRIHFLLTTCTKITQNNASFVLNH